ncbi:rod shape-determining protein MreD [Sneathiella chinensis]|uniref:Rod shape-determining protein MreD n=1 Tax=Sneathiella chinensis TaxID=349750 RepID=A0ABQ5U7I8_9PROT|nr:rod shape-determining protein MreD [Sneathiella chinensis]
MPFWLTFLLAVMTVIPVRIENMATVTPSVVSISVFYWSLQRPYLMPAPAVFLIGLTTDIMTGGPMGMSSLILLLVHWIASSQRQVFVGKAFIQSWWGFLLVATGMAALSWVIMCLYAFAFVPALPFLVQLALTVLLFPAFAWVFGLLQNSILRHI